MDKLISLYILVLMVINIHLATSNIHETAHGTHDAADRSYHHHEDPTMAGVWRKRVVWRPRWVKTWQEKRVYVAVWKHTWGPVELKEWIPIPKPPPGWIRGHDTHSHDWGLKKLTRYPFQL